MAYTPKQIEEITANKGWLSIGASKDGKVKGICLFDKYSWTNIFGFEILK